jgi:hypothetical protein
VWADFPFPQGEYSRLGAGGKGQNESRLGEFAVLLPPDSIGDTVIEVSERFSSIAHPSGACEIEGMNFSMLQHELESLPPEQQDRLSAFLTSLRMRRDGIISEISRRLDDRDTGNWSSWDEVKSDLTGEPDEESP